MFIILFSLLSILSLCAVGIATSRHGPISRRIVKGFEVDIKTFPYAVFLYFDIKRPSTCGSSLITVQAVVTSAHCMQELSFYDGAIRAFLGATIPMYSKVMRDVISYRIHPRYDASRGKFDLSVAKFTKSVPRMHGIHTIPIYQKSIKLNDIMYTAGWGKKWAYLMPDFSDARSLEASQQRVVSVSECLNRSGIKDSPAYICSVPINGFHYRGDLGNGLITLKPAQALVGVVSFMMNDVTLYANVMTQRDWIRKSVKALYGKVPVEAGCC